MRWPQLFSGGSVDPGDVWTQNPGSHMPLCPTHLILPAPPSPSCRWLGALAALAPVRPLCCRLICQALGPPLGSAQKQQQLRLQQQQQRILPPEAATAGASLAAAAAGMSALLQQQQLRQPALPGTGPEVQPLRPSSAPEGSLEALLAPLPPRRQGPGQKQGLHAADAGLLTRPHTDAEAPPSVSSAMQVWGLPEGWSG